MLKINMNVVVYKFLVDNSNSSAFVKSNELKACESISIVSDINQLTSILEYRIPANLCYIINKDANVIKKKSLIVKEKTSYHPVPIEVGDFISIYIYTDFDSGYPAFFGYISDFIEDGNTMIIKGEDSMMAFKRDKFMLSLDKITKRKYKSYNMTYPNYKDAVIVDGLERTTKLKDIVDVIFDNSTYYLKNGQINTTDLQINAHISDLSLGRYKTEKNMTGAQIFEDLKNKYGIYTYFRTDFNTTTYTRNILNDFGEIEEKVVNVNNNVVSAITTFHCGLKYLIDETSNINGYRKMFKFAYPADLQNEKRGKFNDKSNFIIDISQLDYESINKDDDLIVIYTSKQDDNSILQSATDDGKTFKITKDAIKLLRKTKNVIIEKNIPNINQKTLNKFVLDDFVNYPASRLVGTFSTFGQPLVRISDVVDLKIRTSFNNIGDIIEEKYFVDRVDTVLNKNEGFIQYITLGSKVT